MTDTFRALCAELAQQLDDALDFTVSSETRRHMKVLVANARAALAQPEPEGLTDEPLGDLIDKWVQEAFRKRPYGCKHPMHTYVACKAWEHGRNHAARAALAQPEPEGASDRIISIAMAAQKCALAWEPTARLIGNVCAEDIADLCGAVLARSGRPAIEPVPVNERLPGPKDCDGCGNCWWFRQATRDDFPFWWLGGGDNTSTHWLPRHALPVPTPSREENYDV